MAAASDTTLAQFAERYFREIQAKDGKDTKTPRRYLDKDILPFIGTKPVREITAEDVRASSGARRITDSMRQQARFAGC